MQWIPYEVIIFLLITPCYSYPTDICKLITEEDERTHVAKNGPDYHLRDVACIGNSGEIVEAVCCTTPNSSEPWLVVLPTNRNSPCLKPDCNEICTSAIVAHRITNKLGMNNRTDDKKAYAWEMEGKGWRDWLSRRNHSSQRWKIIAKKLKRILKSPMRGFKRTFVRSNKRKPLKTLKSVMDYVDYLDALNSPLSPLAATENPFSYYTFNIQKLEGISKNEFLPTTRKDNGYTPMKKTKVSLVEVLSKKPLILEPKLATHVTKPVTRQCFNSNIEIKQRNGEPLSLNKAIKVPSLVLEILQLCKHVEKLNINCPELKSMCKSIDLPVEVFLNSLLFCSSNNERQSINSKLVQNTEPQVLNNENEHSTTYFVIPANDENTVMPCFTIVLSVTIPPFMTDPNKIASDEFGLFTLTASSPITELSTKRIHYNIKRPEKSCECKKNKLSQNEKMKQLLMSVLSFPKACDALQLQSQFSSSCDSNESGMISHYIKGVNSVELIVSDINEKYRKIFSLYKRASWDYETNVSHFTRQKAMEAALTLTQHQMSMASQLLSLSNEPIENPAVLRQIKLLYMSGMNYLPEIEWNEFEQVIFGMQTVYTSASVNKWNSNCIKVTINPEISDIMATSRNPDELKYYWVEWRNATGKRMRNLFDQYVSLMECSAKKNGFHDASEMWVSQYESEDFFDSLNIHWEDIRPLYCELHAYVRHRLHELYGDVSGATDSGKIPAHLTGDIWGQNWKNLYDEITLLKSSSCSFFSYIIDKLTKKSCPLEIARDTEKMFMTLGFSKFPKSFWENSIFEKEPNTLMNCEPSAWDFYDCDDYRNWSESFNLWLLLDINCRDLLSIRQCCCSVAICSSTQVASQLSIYNDKSKPEDKEEIQHLITLCEYYKQYSLLPFVYRKEPMPGFHDGMAGAVVLSCKSARHYNLIRSVDEDIDALLKMALTKVAFLPYSYILDLWRHKVFRGEITSSEYNSKWWELRASYQGIKPPIERTEEDLDIASKHHIAANKPYIKYFVSTLLEFQFHEALCKIANITGPLYKCDFTTCLKAGKVMRKVMGMGATEHWKVAMEELTGKRRIESAPLFRYFQPLYEWLKEKNRVNKVIVGWND